MSIWGGMVDCASTHLHRALGKDIKGKCTDVWSEDV